MFILFSLSLHAVLTFIRSRLNETARPMVWWNWCPPAHTVTPPVSDSCSECTICFRSARWWKNKAWVQSDIFVKQSSLGLYFQMHLRVVTMGCKYWLDWPIVSCYLYYTSKRICVVPVEVIDFFNWFFFFTVHKHLLSFSYNLLLTVKSVGYTLFDKFIHCVFILYWISLRKSCFEDISLRFKREMENCACAVLDLVVFAVDCVLYSEPDFHQ